MRARLFQIDAFTTRRFAGNPAAVMLLDAWLDDGLLQALAAENNLAETAFLVPQGSDFHIRWFTRPSRWRCADTRPRRTRGRACVFYLEGEATF